MREMTIAAQGVIWTALIDAARYVKDLEHLIDGSHDPDPLPAIMGRERRQSIRLGLEAGRELGDMDTARLIDYLANRTAEDLRRGSP